jgi:hypothetical protein
MRKTALALLGALLATTAAHAASEAEPIVGQVSAMLRSCSRIIPLRQDRAQMHAATDKGLLVARLVVRAEDTD